MRDIKLGFLDRVFKQVAPGLCLRRIAARARIDMIQAGRRSLSEIYGHRREARIKTTETANKGLRGFDKVRDELRRMEYSDGVVGGAVRRLTRLALGSGLIPRAIIRGNAPREVREAVENQVDDALRAWMGSREADYSRTSNFAALQRRWFRRYLVDGEVGINIVPGGRSSSFRLRTVESDLIPTTTTMKGDERIVYGVRVDVGTGEPLGYYVAKDPDIAKPGAASKAEYIPRTASDGSPIFIHYLDRNRTHQMRGYSPFSPALKDIQDLDRYFNAEITATIIASCLGFTVTTARNIGSDTDLPTDTDTDGNSFYDWKLEPGFIQELNQDEKIEAVEHKRPGSQFSTTIRSLMYRISFATGIPYCILFQDFSDVNYSSARYAGQDGEATASELRGDFISQVLAPIVDEWQRDAVVRGDIRLPAGIRPTDIGYLWIGPKNIMFDPNKEQQANEKGLKLATVTLADLSSRWEEKVEQRVKEIKVITEKMQESGLDPAILIDAPKKTGD